MRGLAGGGAVGEGVEVEEGGLGDGLEGLEGGGWSVVREGLGVGGWRRRV